MDGVDRYGQTFGAARQRAGEQQNRELRASVGNAEYISCNSQRTPERCDMFHALFDQGPVREGAFDEEVQYIF